MKKGVADIVVSTLIELGITECFSVVGGGAMHLNNAFEINDNMHVTFCHHEQSCSFAAEGYAKHSGHPAVVSVTSGPGSVNALNGVYSAWVDSTPMIVISGHPRSDTTVESCGLNLRCRGVQEYNIIPSVKGMTKYAKMISDPSTVKAELLKAYQIAMDGRRGPVWLSIPLDIQATLIEEESICTYKMEEYNSQYTNSPLISRMFEKIKTAKRPCILTGSGIRYANAMSLFKEFIQKVQIPVVGGALLSDILPEGFQLFYGLSGNIGPRAGNFILQNSDLIIVLGNSLSNRQTGFNVERFAPNAYFIMVDAEKDEPLKPGLHIDMPLQFELKDFFSKALEFLGKESIAASSEWKEYCQKTYRLLQNYDEPIGEDTKRIPAKLFWKKFREKLPENATIALGNSNCVIGIFQYGVKKEGQRVITNYNAGSMGVDLPEAIGVAISSGEDVYCVTGDGSIMMNLQELETIKYNHLPVKIVIFSNDGYGAIRQTCKNYFDGTYTGCDPSSGIDFPQFKKIADAFDFKYFHCKQCNELDKKIEDFIHTDGLVILEIDQMIDDPVIPRMMSKMDENGHFTTPDLTDMHPYIEKELLQELSL